MNALADFFANRVLGPVWNFLDGKKTYIAAGAGILSGAAGLITDFQPALAAHSAMGVVDACKALPNNPHWIMLIGALGALGIGHKLDKATPDVAPEVKP